MPRFLHCGLESQHQHSLGLHAFSELIGGEGLAETHLRIPKEVRRTPIGLGIFLRKICYCLLYGSALFLTHREREETLRLYLCALAYCLVGIACRFQGAAAPLALHRIAVLAQVAMNSLIGEGLAAAIRIESRALPLQTLRLIGTNDIVLLSHSYRYITGSLPNLEPTGLCYAVAIDVYLGCGALTFWQHLLQLCFLFHKHRGFL